MERSAPPLASNGSPANSSATRASAPAASRSTMSFSGPSVGPGKIMGGADCVGVAEVAGDAVGALVAPAWHAARVMAARNRNPAARGARMAARRQSPPSGSITCRTSGRAAAETIRLDLWVPANPGGAVSIVEPRQLGAPQLLLVPSRGWICLVAGRSLRRPCGSSAARHTEYGSRAVTALDLGYARRCRDALG